MPLLFEHQLPHGDYQYKIRAASNDLGKMARVGEITVWAARKHKNDENWEAFEIRMELHADKGEIHLFANDKAEPIATLSIEKLPQAAISILDSDLAETDPEQEIGLLEAMLDQINDGDATAEIAELILDRFPTDPIIGCLVKGALSTVLGRVIRCWFPIRREVRPPSELLGMLGNCLGENKWQMAKTFVWRSATCAMRLGF